MDELREEVRRLCPDCRTPEENGLRNGYTCPAHWPLLLGQEMPTVSETRYCNLCTQGIPHMCPEARGEFRVLLRGQRL